MLPSAQPAAAHATCPTRRAGAVLVCADGSQFIGYEGAPHGIAHCDVTGCRVTAAGDVCENAVRAELNALLRAARLGAVSTVGSTLIVSEPLHPSVVGAVVNAGVARVVCKGPVARGVQSILQLANIELEYTDADP